MDLSCCVTWHLKGQFVWKYNLDPKCTLECSKSSDITQSSKDFISAALCSWEWKSNSSSGRMNLRTTPGSDAPGNGGKIRRQRKTAWKATIANSSCHRTSNDLTLPPSMITSLTLTILRARRTARQGHGQNSTQPIQARNTVNVNGVRPVWDHGTLHCLKVRMVGRSSFARSPTPKAPISTSRPKPQMLSARPSALPLVS